MIIVIMGPQGSGKGTQADKLAQKYKLKHISIGDVLRDEVNRHGPYADIVKKCMDQGDLIPDKINDEIAKRVIERYKEYLILDGYPRSIHQANFLLSIAKVDVVIVLDITDKVAVDRISKRLICTSNHKVFIEDKITPMDIHDCTVSGGEIIKRDDDKKENVLRRLEVYHKETKPVIDFFKKNNVEVIQIDASSSIDDVFKKIEEELE
jgi:adenylate kinase